MLPGAALALLAAFVIAKLPATDFSQVTGGLLALLCIMLVGSGMPGLQTAALMTATPVTWFPDAAWWRIQVQKPDYKNIVIPDRSIAFFKSQHDPIPKGHLDLSSDQHLPIRHWANKQNEFKHFNAKVRNH